MSNSIQLSHELIDNVMQAIVDHDKAVTENGTLGLQYLAAILGVLAADYPGNEAECEELLTHLHEFTKHVYGDQARSRQQQAAQQSAQSQAPQSEAAKGRCEPDPDEPAAGVWRVDRG
jgi:hypothetical protein